MNVGVGDPIESFFEVKEKEGSFIIGFIKVRLDKLAEERVFGDSSIRDKARLGRAYKIIHDGFESRYKDFG